MEYKTGYWCEYCGTFSVSKPKNCNYNIKILNYEKLHIFFEKYILENTMLDLYEKCYENSFIEDKDIYDFIKCDSEIFRYETRNETEILFNINLKEITR